MCDYRMRFPLLLHIRLLVGHWEGRAAARVRGQVARLKLHYQGLHFICLRPTSSDLETVVGGKPKGCC